MSTLTTAPFFVPPALLEEVREAYSRPPRAYHSFAHVEAVLRHFADVAAGPGWLQPNEVYLAVLFHDAVYQAGHHDNEAKSAQLARRSIATHLPTIGVDADRVSHLIELTARHGSLTAAELDPDAALFLDADMAILGAPPHIFDAYDRGVAQEYAPVVDPEMYRQGRKHFLAKVLASPRIFFSPYFHSRLDAQARANLQRSLNAL